MPLPRRDPGDPHRTANDFAYAQLREWIIEGPLESGESLRDTEVATLLGVGRTPVREALIRLSQEGLVEVTPGRGTRVAELDLSRAGDFYQLGAVLDGFAARVAVQRITKVDLDAMRTILARMSASDDPVELERLDLRFHRVYYDAAGNDVLNTFMERVASETRRIERVAFGSRALRGAAHEEHAQILQALEERDAERVERFARENWVNSWERIQAEIAPRLAASTDRRVSRDQASTGSGS